MTFLDEDLRENPLNSLNAYELSHLFGHLAACENLCEAFEILTLSTRQGRNAWFAAQFARNNVSGFTRDVQIAWRLISEKIDTEGGVIPSESIAREVQCALMISSINTSLEEILPEILPAAVATQLWSSREALAVATQPLEWALRLRCVTALLPILLAQDRSAIEILFGLLHGKPRGEKSRSVIGVGDSRESKEELADYADEHLKATVFERVSFLIPDEAVERAVEIAETIRVPWSRATAVASVASRLRPEIRQEVIVRTLEFVRGVGKPSLRAECLALLAPYMPLAEKAAVLNEAWQLQVRAFSGDPDERRFALTTKTGTLRLLDGTTRVEEATCGLKWMATQFDEASLLTAIEEAKHFRPQYTELSLMCLAPRLTAFGRRNEALETIAKFISNDYLNLVALLEVDRHGETVPRSELAESRLKHAEGINDPIIRARAKVLVGNVYPETITAEFAFEAFSACKQVTDDTHYKAVQIKDVVSGLDTIAQQEHSQIVAQALEICQSITDYEQDIAMRPLTRYLDRHAIREILLASFTVDGSSQSGHLKKMAVRVLEDPVLDSIKAPAPWDQELIVASVDALREIVRTANDEVNPEDLKDYGERAAASRGARRHGDAEVWAQMFAAEEENNRLALAGRCAIFLAPRLSPEMALDASKAIVELRDFYWRSSALIVLSDRLLDPLATNNIMQAMDSACKVRRDYQLSELLERITRRLTATRIPAIHRIWNECLTGVSRDHRSHVIDFLLSSTALIRTIGTEEAISRLEDVTQTVETWWRPQKGSAQPDREAEEFEPESRTSPSVMGPSAIADVLSALSSYFVANNLDKCAATCKEELLRLVNENSTNDEVLEPYVMFMASAADAYAKRRDVEHALELYNDWFGIVSAGDPQKRLMTATVSFSAIYACCEAQAFTPAQEILSRLISLARNHQEEQKLQDAVADAYSHFRRKFQSFASDSQEPSLEAVRRSGPFGPGTGTTARVSHAFRETLRRAGMRFVVPQGLRPARLPSDDSLRPLHVLTSNSPSLKVYYFLRTAEEGLSPDLNLVYSKVLDRVSLGKVGPVAAFPEAAVRADFLADRAGTRRFQVNPLFSGSPMNAMGVVLQADGLAEALVLIMYADFIDAQSLMQNAFYSLKFVPAGEAE
jgi:hypothetical protein